VCYLNKLQNTRCNDKDTEQVFTKVFRRRTATQLTH